MNILFYSPFNQRSRDTESVMLAFKDLGHRVISLTQTEGRHIHPFLEEQGIETFSSIDRGNYSFLNTLNKAWSLITFCYKYNVDVVYSHLESANFIAVLAQFFIRARVFVYRHHIDEAALQGFDQSFSYKLTYRLAKRVVVVSKKAYDYALNVERIKEHRLTKVNLGYKWNLYSKPNPSEVKKIRSKTGDCLLLLTVSRLTKYKRVNLSVELLSKLVHVNINAKLIILGTGEEDSNLRILIRQLSIEDKVILKGHVNNVIDYLQATDFLLHPSVLESSCVVVKEAGLVSKPVIVCSDVGDFNDYIKNDINGFSVSREPEEFVKQASDIILANYNDKDKLNRLGSNLHASVKELFSIENLIQQHLNLIEG